MCTSKRKILVGRVQQPSNDGAPLFRISSTKVTYKVILKIGMRKTYEGPMLYAHALTLLIKYRYHLKTKVFKPYV